MKNICNFLLIITCSFYISCSRKQISAKEIDKVMNGLEYNDFKEFKNYTIVIRQKTFTEIIYLVTDDANIDDIKAFVTVNRFNGNILTIDSKLEEIEQKKIKDMMSKYKDFKYPYLSVDEEGNFCINPFFVDMQPYILSMRKESTEKKIKKNLFVFEHYKNNLYINSKYDLNKISK